ncbi:Auxin-responsive protein SAUR36 [Bienertia sinuspersici]
MNTSHLQLRRRSRPPPRGIRILLKKRVARLYRRVTGRVSRVIDSWRARLQRGLCGLRPRLGPNYIRVGSGEDRVSRAPKGHLAVYVGPTKEEEGGLARAKRVVMPVIYINHPLFQKLLEEAEEKYGFDHSGGITIPCPVSEFEKVKTRIASGRARNGPCSPCLGNPL